MEIALSDSDVRLSTESEKPARSLVEVEMEVDGEDTRAQEYGLEGRELVYDVNLSFPWPVASVLSSFQFRFRLTSLNSGRKAIASSRRSVTTSVRSRIPCAIRLGSTHTLWTSGRRSSGATWSSA